MKNLQEVTLPIKILSNQNRFAIMLLLLKSKENLCVNEVADAVGISQSLASHQLAYLEARGAVIGHRTGQIICYRPTNTPLAKKIRAVVELLK